MENYGWGDIGTNADSPCSDAMQCDNIFGIDPFYIEKGDLTIFLISINIFKCQLVMEAQGLETWK